MATVLRKIIAVFMVFIFNIPATFMGIFNRTQSDVVVLYTSDVHCGIDDNIGYAGLAAYVKKEKAEFPNVTLVDCGDSIQGDLVGSLSQGSYVIDIMNYMGYDYAVLGNHEFDYGMEQLSDLIDRADFPYLGCNLTYSGSGENLLEDVEDYAIEDYGDIQVAYIGVTTPYSITSSTPKYFQDEDGNYIYGFEDDLYSCVQKNVVKARMQGADYVVVLSHLGDTEEFSPYSSTELIENTFGIDAVLDGHAHHVIEEQKVENIIGKDVVLSAVGTKLETFGKLTISDGEVSTELIRQQDEKDADTQSYLDTIKAKYEGDLKNVVGTSDVDLPITDENGFRLVRNRETAIGDFVADAYRQVTGADIAFVNGGGVRTSINKGDITYGNMISVNPFGNTLCTINATGQQIADALEWAYRFVQSESDNGTAAVGESGGFLQVSGLKFTIDTSVQSSVTSDSTGLFTGVGGARRVSDIQVLKDGKYVPLDMNATYVVAGSNYVLLNGGDGQTAFKSSKVIADDGMLDYEALISYITNGLGGTIGTQYAAPDGRITVK